MPRILIVDDSATQREKLLGILEGAGHEVAAARDGETALALLSASNFDLVISDIVMPEMSGYELCRRMKAQRQHKAIPVILLSTLNEPMDIIRGLECGADNFVTKPYQPDLLVDRVGRIIANARIRVGQRVAVGIEIMFLGARFTVDSEKEQILDLLLSTFEDTVLANRELLEKRTELAVAKAQIESYARTLEDRVRERTAELARSNEALKAEIAARRQTENELLKTRTFLDVVVENIPAMLFVKSAEDQRFILLNRAGEQLLGMDRTEVVGKSDRDIFPPEQADQFVESDREVLRSGNVKVIDDEAIATRDKGVRLLRTKKVPLLDTSGRPEFLLGFSEDVTERKAIEDHLRQVQKMDAIGRLTGGIAHDFNNLLGVITGNIDLLVEDLGADTEAATLADEALHAALRGSELTQRMLAFARKQPLQPKVIQIGDMVSRMVSMLRRTLGENIAIETVLAGDLWPALADGSQVEDMVLNLAVNARDAMPDGGRLVIETANVRLDETYAEQHGEVTVGDYVMLAVTDSGTGMSPETIERAFEPFFTTKDVGHGTGLGLSMVYGFVKQSRGHIKIYSELGHGTTIRAYLPRPLAGGPAGPSTGPAREEHPAGHETILVVEDDFQLRRVALRILEGLGYVVLEAQDGREALAILERTPDIALLFTDLIMPNGMSGQELAAEATRRRPGLKVLFTSGYSEQFVKMGEFAVENGSLIGKPYRKQELSAKIRATLDG